MREKKVMKLASEGKRFGAYCIDIIVPVIAGIMFFVAIIIILTSYLYDPFSLGYGYPGYGFGYGYGYGRNTSPVSGGTAATLIISILLWIAYIAVQLVFYSRSKTLGKAALGLQVVSSKDGKPIGFWKMLFREWFVKPASGSVFVLGYIWILIDERNRGWHDKILDTYVVDLKESEAISRSRDGYYTAAPAAGFTPPAYAPQVSEAAGTSAAALADKEAAIQESVIPETVAIPDNGPTLEDFVRLEGDGDIRDNVLEVAEVVAVTAQDAVRNTEGYDNVSAGTADDSENADAEVKEAAAEVEDNE